MMVFCVFMNDSVHLLQVHLNKLECCGKVPLFQLNWKDVEKSKGKTIP